MNHHSSHQHQRRRSALEEAQDLALSFALDDDNEDVASFGPQQEELKEQDLSLRTQRLSSSSSHERRSSCGLSASSNHSSHSNPRYQWARAQALVAAMNHSVDSEEEEDSEEEIEEASLNDGTERSATPEKAPKLDEVFSQMVHLGEEKVCTDPDCECKSSEFTISRRTLPMTSLTRKTSASSSEKSVRSVKSVGEFSVSRRTPALTYLGKAQAGSDHSRDEMNARQISIETIGQRNERRVSTEERRFQAEPERQHFGNHRSVSFGKTTGTESVKSDILSEASPEPEKNRSFVIYVLFAMILVLVTIIMVLVVPSSKDANSLEGVSMETSLAPVGAPKDPPTKAALAFVPETICMEQVPGDGWSTACEKEASAEQGGGVCNLVAHAFLDQVITADIAIQSATSCLGDIMEGSFTADDASRVLPFREKLWTIDVSGASIVLVLEQVMEGLWGPIQARDYPYAAGLRFSVNASAPYMSRVSNVEVNERFEQASWKAIEPNAVYTVVAGETLLTGGILTRDNPYKELENAFKYQYPRGKTDTDSLTAFIAFAAKQEILLDPLPEHYSTQAFIPP
eukprot:scaffold1469_cov119-Cylindrotheca_fusiformis.AAC.20